MALSPSTTLAALRQRLLRRLDYPRHPSVSATTSVGTTTTLNDRVLAPAAVSEDFIGAWIYVAENATAAAAVPDSATLTSTITAVVTTLTYTSAGDPFTVGTYIKIDSEIMKVTAINTGTNVLTLIRAQGSTAAAAHGAATAINELQGPALGEIARVTNVNFSGATSQLTLAPALSVAIETDIDYEIHRDFHPDMLLQTINRQLEDGVRTPFLIPLSLVVGGDMEGTPATDFTAGGGAVLTTETTTVLHGRKSLKVDAAGGANGQARGQTVSLAQKTLVLCSADVFVTNADAAKLILRGLDGTAEDIETAESAESGWVHLEFTADIKTHEQVTLYLESKATGDITYWDNAVLLSTTQKALPYPSALEYHDDVLKVFVFPLGRRLSATGDDSAYAVLEEGEQFWSHATPERDETAVVPYRLQLAKAPTRPVWINATLPFTKLSVDTDTTKAPPDLVTELAYADLLEDLAARAGRRRELELAEKLLVDANVIRQRARDANRGYTATPRAVVHGALR